MNLRYLFFLFYVHRSPEQFFSACNILTNAIALIISLFVSFSTSSAQNPSSHPDDHYWSNKFAPPSLGGAMSPIVATPDKLYGVARRILPAPGETYTGFKPYNLVIWDGTGWQVTGPGAFTAGGFSTQPSTIAVEGTEVYVGGNFDAIEGQPYNYIARWNNNTWNHLGSGLNGYVSVIKATGNFEIFVGGEFSATDTLPLSNIARWNGTWHPLFDLGGAAQGTSGLVRDLSVTGTNMVYAVGDFGIAGGQPVSGFARWNSNPESWTGFGTTFFPYTPSKVSHWGPYVFAGGMFTEIDGDTLSTLARFQAPGGPWTWMGNPQSLLSMAAAPSGDLYASIYYPALSNDNVLAKWDGISWSIIPGQSASFTDIAFQENSVYASGSFGIPGKQLNGMGRWDGTEWHALGNGIEGWQGAGSEVRALEFHNGALYAGGLFGAASGEFTSGLCRWNGSKWEAVDGFNEGTVNSIASHNNILYIAGGLASIDGIPPGGVAAWDGNTWTSLDSGFSGGTKMLFHDGQYLYAHEYSGSPARMKRWDGVSWSDVGDAIGGSDITSIAKLGSDLYVSGGFFGDPFIYKWDGGATWTGITGLNNHVYALKTYGNDLYVGGRFTTADGITVNGIARWDGANWHAVGAGFPGGAVRCMEFDVDGNLYVGGEFGDVSTGTTDSLFSVAKWDGSKWTRLGKGVFHTPVIGFPYKAIVYAMKGTNEGLFFGGMFTHAGDKYSWDIALWTDYTPASSEVTAVQMQPSWNMVSVPRTVPDYRKNALFPSAISNAFAFAGAGGYVVEDTLENRVGYWLKFPESKTVSISGLPRTTDTMSVNQSWNFIGSLSEAVPVTNITSIPGGIVTSSFFGFDGAYFAADTLYPGRGYWVRVDQNGKLVLSSLPAITPSNRIRIVPTEEIPPPMPEER